MNDIEERRRKFVALHLRVVEVEGDKLFEVLNPHRHLCEMYIVGRNVFLAIRKSLRQSTKPTRSSRMSHDPYDGRTREEYLEDAADLYGLDIEDVKMMADMTGSVRGLRWTPGDAVLI